MSRRYKAYLLLLLVSMIWGAASPVVKHTLLWFPPWLFLTYRFAISTAIALPYISITKAKFPKKSRDVWLLWLTCLISAPLSLFLFFLALDKTTSLSGSLITAIGPLILIVGGVLFFHERITKYEKFGIGIALIGTIITVLGPMIMNGHADTLGKLEGNSIMLLAVITDMVGALLSKKSTDRGISITLIAQFQFIVGFLIFLPILLLWQTPAAIVSTIVNAPFEAHAGVFFMAVISGTIAYTLRIIAVKPIEISEAALFNYLSPLWAAILSVLWLGESITASYIVGGSILAFGVMISEYRGDRRQKQK